VYLETSFGTGWRRMCPVEAMLPEGDADQEAAARKGGELYIGSIP